MRNRDLVPAAFVVIAAYHLGLGLLMVVDPGYFWEEIGPYGSRNDHYTRDAATFYLAIAGVAAVGAARASWRVPVLAYLALQYLLHAINHLFDVGEARDSGVGAFNLVSIAIGAAIFGLLLARVRERERG